MIRVRFAPSPTGHLHIGAARTAFFNWLFARRNKGKFILRIEDTDVARSSKEMSQGIVQGLKWLEIDWDEGPFLQSERLDVYRDKAEGLVQKGHAYFCYCLPQEIKKRKEGAFSKGQYWEYDRLCLNISEEKRKRFESEGRPRAIRFLVPDGEIKYTDLIHGTISVQNTNIEDFVLLRSDGLPTYHLSVVVDDIDQRITHIIRGDDHISNTPKQILIYQAFNSSPPEFAHLALILGPDRKKISKRHGVTSVLQFRDEGYFPLALLNYLALMSWSPGEEGRIYTVAELVDKFSLERVYKSSPIFDLVKLQWLNGQVLSQTAAHELERSVKEALQKENLWQEDLEDARKEWFYKLIDLLKQRSRMIMDLPPRARPFLSDSYPYDPDGVKKHLNHEGLGSFLQGLKRDFEKIEFFSAAEIEYVLRKRAEQEGIKAALLIHALRMLVLGMQVSPGIFEVLELVGKKRTTERIDRLKEILQKIKNASSE